MKTFNKEELLKKINEDLEYWEKKIKFEVNDYTTRHLKGRIDYLKVLKNVSNFTKDEMLTFLYSSFGDIKTQYKVTRLTDFKYYLQGKISIIENYINLIEGSIY